MPRLPVQSIMVTVTEIMVTGTEIGCATRQNRLALIGLPFDRNSSYMKGAAQAPPLIREALSAESSNLWTENGIDLGYRSVIFDAGDLDAAVEDPEVEIETSIANLLERGFNPIALGGDHSVTWPVVRAFAGKYRNLEILHLDAHPDIYDEYQGNRRSHASPFARIMEENLARRLVQVGIRTLNEQQRKQVEKFGVELVEISNWQNAMPFVFESPLYISVDLDVLDPAFAPGVSHWEPGGLSTRELLRLIQSVQGTVVGADIVEFNPRRDPVGITAMAAAKILKEIAAKILA